MIPLMMQNEMDSILVCLVSNGAYAHIAPNVFWYNAQSEPLCIYVVIREKR